MGSAITPAQAHKQYQEMVNAYRALIPDPTLRMEFAAQADDYFRTQAMGVIPPEPNPPPRCTGRLPPAWRDMTCFAPLSFFSICGTMTGERGPALPAGLWIS